MAESLRLRRGMGEYSRDKVELMFTPERMVRKDGEVFGGGEEMKGLRDETQVKHPKGAPVSPGRPET
ncbi:hypothetical protein [Desulfonatronospira sp.]|uniref:hypothetical protein n=1 Tax=Desulfonatronospira sp. TaxID=1962951 RepID=UPI0025C08035|nr:hypothetical protein [Desulfonatronospira sp.]